MIEKIIKGAGIGCLIYIVIVVALSGGVYYYAFRADNAIKRATALIEKMEFAKARELLDGIESWHGTDDYNRTLENICRAQVFHLISQGEYPLAKQIATEDGLPRVYTEVLMTQLPQIYGQHSTLSIFNALAIISFPDEQAEYDKQVHTYNTSLDSFCKALCAMGKKEDAKAFLNLLKPDYNGSTSKINKIKSQYR